MTTDTQPVIKTTTRHYTEYKNTGISLCVKAYSRVIYLFENDSPDPLSFSIQQAKELHACLTQALTDYEAAQAGKVSA